MTLSHLFLYAASLLTGLWGVAHLFPTKNVVAGFDNISTDNRHIITMEWIVEGVALIFIGVLVAVVTYVDSLSAVSSAVYAVTVLALLALSVVAFLTGFKVAFLPFRMCPFVMASAALLITIGAII